MRRTARVVQAALVVILVAAGGRLASAEPVVSLTTTLPSGQPVGTGVTLVGTVQDPAAVLTLFQFAVRPAGGEWHILRDFSAWSRFRWATLEEGTYQLRATALVLPSGDIGEVIVPFIVVPRVTATAVVSPTSHPLVALFSAPDCFGGHLWVRFRALGDQYWQRTTAKPCAAKSINMYVAGMRPFTSYEIQAERLVGGQIVHGPMLMFTTGAPELPFHPRDVLDPADTESSLAEGVLLQTHVVSAPETNAPFATDLRGNILWYYPELADPTQVGAVITRPLWGGNMLLTMHDRFQGQVLREIDLAGNIVRETNAPWVGWQLTEMGQDPIGAFHHDAVRLPNGHTVVIASVERVLHNVQGSGDVNVYGEMIVDLDENFQVAWAWNGFDHLDPRRSAMLGETCTSQAPGCPPLFLDDTANDWLHANALHYVPEDGSLLLSLRHQDWIIKIDYQHGTGSGDVLWRLGAEGDFDLVADDPWPWFSHQHDTPLYGDHLVVYDNGNTRIEGPDAIGGNSRGQVWQVDESEMVATLVESFDLGDYAPALGSAQRLSNGNYHFNSGFLNANVAPVAQSIEMSPVTGAPTFVLEVEGGVYRSFRLRDLYHP